MKSKGEKQRALDEESKQRVTITEDDAIASLGEHEQLRDHASESSITTLLVL